MDIKKQKIVTFFYHLPCQTTIRRIRMNDMEETLETTLVKYNDGIEIVS